MTVERELPNNFFASLSYVGTKGTHLPSAMSPLNVIDPPIRQSPLWETDLRVSYNDAGRSGDLCQVRREHSVRGLGKPDESCAPTLAQALTPYPQYCGVVQGQNEQHATSNLQLVPVPRRKAQERRAVCACGR